MNISTLKVTICTVFGAIGSFIASLFGGWSVDLTTLLFCMAVDYLTGIYIAMVLKKSPKTKSGALSSNVGFKGLCKKCAILLCVMIAYRLDITLGFNYIKTAAVIAFMVNELVSIAENMGIMGVPWPPFMIKAIDLLKNKKDGNQS